MRLRRTWPSRRAASTRAPAAPPTTSSSRAVGDAMRGRVDAVATAPVSKEAFAIAGLPWKGHTDLLGHLTGSSFVAMMFESPALRVVLATVHVALQEVPRLLTTELMIRTIRLTARELPAFGVAEPRIAVAGLNPHAGEHGLMGHEDDAVICAGRGAMPRRWDQRLGPAAGRHRVSPRAPRRVRRRHRVLPRSGPDSGEAAGLRAGRQRHPGAADRAHVGRSRHGVRHRRPRPGRSRIDD